MSGSSFSIVLTVALLSAIPLVALITVGVIWYRLLVQANRVDEMRRILDKLQEQQPAA